MAQKWNLQDIRPPGGRERQRRPQGGDPQQDMVRKRKKRPAPDPELGSVPVLDGNRQKMKRLITAVVVAILIIAAGFAFSLLLGGAEVTVNPKYKDSTVQATFTAHREPAAGELGFELLTLEADGEKQVSATGEEAAKERTTGNVFIYNAFSTTPQRLIKNTRFESPEGLVFRIEESVEVPGYTEDEDGSIVPGVVTARVFADGTGEQYNIAPTRFTIPGLRGTEQYDKMYAESTNAFEGGFEGTRFIIDEGELQTAQQALHLELRDALLARLEAERPSGFVLYDDAVTFTFETLPATEYGDNLATIKERARLQVPIFEEAEFAQYLAENTVAGYEGGPVAVTDPYTMAFSYPRSTSTQDDISLHTNLEFTLSGSTRIVWIFDEESLKSDLAGLSKTALQTVLSGYPAIERAEAVVRPFWAQSFPEKASEITILQNIGVTE